MKEKVQEEGQRRCMEVSIKRPQHSLQDQLLRGAWPTWRGKNARRATRCLNAADREKNNSGDSSNSRTEKYDNTSRSRGGSNVKKY